MNQPLTQQRVRIRFGKHGSLRFVGHLDLAQTWERVLRRAQVPLEYTQGFNPRPRLQFAAALPVGVTSESEYLDAWLTQPLGGDFPGEWIERLNATCPPGLRVYDLQEVAIRGPALPTLAATSEYVITPADETLSAEDLAARARDLLAREEIMRQGRKKPYDLRPRVLDLRMNEQGQLIAHLVTSERGNARPDELLDAMGLELNQARAHRRTLHLRDAK